jgi:hypothetical protein
MSRIALIFSGLTSILWWEMMNPRSYPAGTPKVHIVGLSIMLYFLRLSKVSCKSAIRPSCFLDITAMSSTYVWMFHLI